MNRIKTANAIYQLLDKTYPNIRCSLTFNNAFELLIATILSAQCTDKTVNRVTPELFRQYPHPVDLSLAKLNLIKNIIKPTGFFKKKSSNIIETSKLIVSQFNNSIPKTVEELIVLPGVGRKTANVVLSNAFNINEGIAVDTHVKRVSRLLNFTKESTPQKIESDLQKLFNKKNWGRLSLLLINHGREICIAKKPNCTKCLFRKNCLYN